MGCNVGTLDKTIRLYLGTLIMLIGLGNESWWGLLGLIPIVTGLYKWCFAYSILNMDTVKDAKGESSKAG